MKKFIVNSAILPADMDPMDCWVSIPKMLKQKEVKNVNIDTCYCCSGEKDKPGVVVVFEAPSKEALSDALNKIDFPVEAIKEVIKKNTK